MEGRSIWNPVGTQFLCILVFIFGVETRGSWSLNDEELTLFQFRENVRSDPYGVLANWNLNDDDPCLWFGVHCVAGKVHTLNLTQCSLGGTLAPELGKLIHLRSLLLRDNSFYGILPREMGNLKKLEILDVRDNNLSGTVPVEIERLQTLKCLWVSGNRLEGNIIGKMRRLKLLSHLEIDGCIVSTSSPRFDNVNNRKFENDMWMTRLKNPTKQDTNILTSSLRRRLQEQQQQQQQSSNLAALPPGKIPSARDITDFIPITRGSGAFPAIPNKKLPSSPPSLPNTDGSQGNDSGNGSSNADGEPPKGPIVHDHAPWDAWMYFLIALMVVVLMASIVLIIVLCRRRGGRTIAPWKTGISGQLQMAFTTGVPKLNRQELETACEDFSNIIGTFDGGIVYKGTLSSGVEIAVVSTTTTSRKEWSRTAEKAFRKKIDTLSRVNHKNFVNLIGFCEEDQPFSRVMVLEYAPNGSLFEHIHDQDMEHLDWASRMRIIMGVAYCLCYMHHDLTPPVSHSNLCSRTIFLSDDYAAKVAEIPFQPQAALKASDDENSEHSELPAMVDPETNVYSFGVVILEVISGKRPYSEKEGPIEKWAAEYLRDKSKVIEIKDKSLKEFMSKDPEVLQSAKREFEVLCEVAEECVNPDPRRRPTMKEIVPKLREVITISEKQAVPMLSPLWWAEIELLGDT